jgi:hypothetical protein
MIEDKLREILERGGDWQRIPVKGLSASLLLRAVP